MPLSIGIVGLPNAGKSTLFTALTKKQVPIANYPFTTIDPHVGVVEVPDERLAKLAAVSKSEKIIPTTVSFVDIAGLVAGASKGEGLGNKFLANIREVDAIVHVVRAFSDQNVVHVAGKIDPKSDFETIETELILADLQTVEKVFETTKKKAKATAAGSIAAAEAKEAKQLALALEKIKPVLEAGKRASSVALSEEETRAAKGLHLLTVKPFLIVLNTDEPEIAALPRVARNDDTLVTPSSLPIAISAKLEAEIVELPPDEQSAYMKELGIAESGLDRLIRAAYDLLGLLTFFTSGPKETRAWTITRGAKAPQAAGVIHTDFERGFIAAEVIDWKTLLDLSGEAAAKAKGLLRLEGKEYTIADGDVVHFRFSV